MATRNPIVKQKSYIWLVSNIVSGIFLLSIIILWSMVNNRFIPSKHQISNASELNQRLAFFKKTYVPPNFSGERFIIPTGIFIQSFEFLTSNTVQVSGYVWQKVDKSALKKGVTPGIVFPEAKSIAHLKKAYDYDFGDYRSIGWHFYGVSLLQNFNYSSYPFDVQSIWIRIWPQDFYHNILLVPDLDSYLSTKPGEKFGLEEDIVKQGFQIQETYFDMPVMHYDTSFGEPKDYIEKNSLEFYFNIIVKRDLINAFLIHLLPIIVIWFVLFAITMIISNDKGFTDRVGLSTTRVFTALGGIIFSVILMNNNLRYNYFDQPILFMEYFYLITYVIVLLVSYDAYVVTTKRKIHYAFQENLLPKTLFWPMLLGCIFVFTLLKFFIFPDEFFLHGHI